MTEIPVVQPEIHDDRSTDERIQAAANSHVNVVRVDFGGTVYVALIAFAIVIGACGVMMGLDLAERVTMQRAFEDEQRAWRMEELKYDELNLTLQRAGLVLPGDYRRGVTGNTQPKERR